MRRLLLVNALYETAESASVSLDVRRHKLRSTLLTTKKGYGYV